MKCYKQSPSKEKELKIKKKKKAGKAEPIKNEI